MTGLDFQTVPVEFRQGIDGKTQQKLVVRGKWTDLLNMSLTDEWTPKIRDGHAALVAAANGNSLFERSNELLTINGSAVSSISPNTSTAVGVTGIPGYVGITKTEIQRNTGMQDCPDIASNGSLTCYVWRAKSTVNAVTGFAMTLVDETSGTEIQANVTLHTSATSDWIRVVATIDAFFILYRDGNQLFARVVTFAAPSVLGAETSIINSGNLAGVCAGDACLTASGTRAFIAYPWSDGATSIQAITIQRSGTTPSIFAGPISVIDQASLQVASITAVTCCLYGNTSDTLVAATGNLGTKSGLAGSVLNAAGFVTAGPLRISATTSTTTSPNHLGACAEPGQTTQIRIFRDFISELSTNALNTISQVIVDNAGPFVIIGPGNVQSSATFGGGGVKARGPQGPFIHGKPFTNGTNVFLPIFVFSVYNGLAGASANPRTANTQNTYFLMDCGPSGGIFSTTPAVCGRALYGSLGLASINGNAPVVSICSTPPVASGASYASLAGELTQLVLSSGNNISPTGLVRLTLSPNTTQQLPWAQLGESAYVAGGQLSAYPGQMLTEQCFPLFPEGIGLTAGGAGTGSMTDGVHQVVAVYAWVDNAGQRHQSAPSLPVTVTVASGANTGSITVSVPTLLVSQKTGVEIQIYCTTAAGLTFFRALLTGGAYQPLMNSTTVNALSTYVISEADATLSGNEPLYTQPNQAPTTLPNLAPAPCTFIWTAHRRLWFDKSDKPGWFGYSQEYLNNVGLQFNDALEDSLPVEAGRFVAGAELDEKVILFGRNRIYVMYGTGPDASGAFNSYSHPQQIPSPVGCSDALSVLRVPQGIIFKSTTGWYLLDRGLTVRYVGEGAASFDDGTVMSAVLLDSQQECRFVLGGAEAGVTLAWSYLLEQWSQYESATGYVANAAIWWPSDGASGDYVTISTTAGLNHDTAGVYFDNEGGVGATAYVISGATGWLRLGGIEAFQRVRELYLSMTAQSVLTSTLVLTFRFDEGTGVSSRGAYSVTIPMTGILPTGSTCDIRHVLKVQKCKSVKISFQDTSASPGATRILGIQAMALSIGLKKGLNKLPAAQSV